MDYASEVAVHRTVHNMGHKLAAVQGLGSNQVSHIVGTMVAMVAVQPVLLVAQEGKVCSVLVSVLSEDHRLAVPRSLRVLSLDYS